MEQTNAAGDPALLGAEGILLDDNVEQPTNESVPGADESETPDNDTEAPGDGSANENTETPGEDSEKKGNETPAESGTEPAVSEDETKTGTDETKSGEEETKTGTEETKSGTEETKSGEDETKTLAPDAQLPSKEDPSEAPSESKDGGADKKTDEKTDEKAEPKKEDELPETETEFAKGPALLGENPSTTTESAVLLDVRSDSIDNETYYFGGIAGRYVTDDLKNSLILDTVALTVTSSATFNAFGGAIGLVDCASTGASAAYIKVLGARITATGTNKDKSAANYAYFGGLVGATAQANDRGVFIDLGDFTLTTNENFRGGGVVGQFYSGVLRLSGTTNLLGAKPVGSYQTADATARKESYYGQLVGYRDNVLVYALGGGSDSTPSYGSGWRYVRSNGSIADDLGTWGEVVRMFDTNNAEGAEIVAFDNTNHTATLAAPPSVPEGGTTASISSKVDFAKLALNIQLSQLSESDCLRKTSVATQSDLLSGSYQLTATVSLSLAGTGLTGLMRDGSADGTTGSIGTFSGTFDGNGKTLTLAVGEEYGVPASENVVEGKGQIYRHQFTGLLAVVGGEATVNGLTLNGSITVRNAGIDGTYVGGVAACANGSVTLDGVTASQTVNYHEGAKAAGTEAYGKDIGGLIAYVNDNGTDNGTIAITGATTIGTVFNLSGHHENWVVVGAAIGKIAARKFVVNIEQTGSDTMTVSHTVNASEVTDKGGNTDGGGLIGYILKSSGSYKTREVNIKNLVFDGCSIDNPATDNGGGFLGYSWQNTTATIDGLTVTSGTINNTAPAESAATKNIGLMCYEATGVWKVNSLTVNGLTMTSGATDSLGMIVNKAFKRNDNNTAYTGGLYLDVLKAGYTLNNTADAITLPASLPKYDEIAAYTAKDADGVLSGGAGVVSINMNTQREPDVPKVKVTDTGTYQNQLQVNNANVKKPNATTRYYYNLDEMTSDNDGQNLLLWSVHRYAYSDIKDEFNTSFNTDKDIVLSGDADLTGLSWYPLKNAPSCTLSGLTLTFDYSGIYTAEKAANLQGGSDSYVRDPGDTGSARNQHYLMHSGLFIDQGTNEITKQNENVVTITNGESNTGLTLKGNFLEVGDYRGVLFSGTMCGRLTSTSGKIVLDGIIPVKPTGTEYNAASDTGYYLLIHNIARSTAASAIAPEVRIYNVYNTDAAAYQNGAIIADSLIGAATGTGLRIVFSKIKLDARTTALQGNGGLDAAYHTTRSLFSKSTLLASIKADQASQLIYNYTYDDDWGSGGRNVTYGKEVSVSVEYSGEESKYYDTPRNFTNPVSNTNTETSFASGWLPYVYVAYSTTKDESGRFNRELKVNVMTTTIDAGCGTYNDPYVFSGENAAKVLTDIANFISTGITDPTTTPLNEINLPKTQYDGLAANTTGARWCEDKTDHAKYTYDSTPESETYGKYIAVGAEPWDPDNVRLYLCGAYYSIPDEITLGSSFPGLGSSNENHTSGKYAFRGVIVGNGQKITNNSDKPFIKVSNGCVVKDITVQVNANIDIRQDNNTYSNAYFGYNSDSNSVCMYYGGMIGEIMGGDNIIDNSYVEYRNSTITLQGTSATIVPVGGYVGVVVYGGLIFKNMSAAKANNTGISVKVSGENDNLADNSTQAAWAAIYVNPLVGRVINGYAVNETTQFSVTEDGHYHDDARSARTGGNGAALTKHTLKNGTKHYSIADIDPSLSKLDVTSVATSSADGNINVPNAQALFILSLITQSCAGTATTADSTSSTTDNTVETSRTTDESGNVTIYKTRTITSNAGLSDYSNALSYGTYSDSVYGMSHTASYSDVGTATSSSSDYSTFASIDTAEKTALPYIIRHYTVGGESTNTTSSNSTNTIEASDAGGVFVFTGSDPDGQELYIEAYHVSKYINAKNTEDAGLQAVGNTTDATKMTFTKQNEGVNVGKYTITFDDNGITKYIAFNTTGDNNNKRKLVKSTTPYYFTVTKGNDNTWTINGLLSEETSPTGSRRYIGLRNSTHFTGQKEGDGTQLVFYYEVAPSSTTTTTITTTITKTTAFSYPARCVTSTAGYYDINLTGSGTYVLPDSFRGLGSVGNYDTVALESETTPLKSSTTEYLNRATNKFCIKLDSFNGNGLTIDADIYLNRFQTDNYLNVRHNGASQDLSTGTSGYSPNHRSMFHGIGLFDSVILKNEDSRIGHFTLSGSVNTEIYNNGYKTTKNDQQIKTINGNNVWLCSGGVVGWATNATTLGFNSIHLNDLKVSGSSIIGGLLGYSGLSSVDFKVVIEECTSENLSLSMTSAASSNMSRFQPRNAIGALVGKVQAAAVYIYGTEYGSTNTNLNDYSTVELSGFAIGNGSTEYYVSAGGLVGFAGNGCKVYDMLLTHSDGQTVTIGNSKTRFAGGYVGAMQSMAEGGNTGVAVFKNCTVQEINVNGNFAGGFYGGKWDSGWTTYSITLDNCKMLGQESEDNSQNNTIIGNDVFGDRASSNDTSTGTKVGYAGGLVGRLYPFNNKDESNNETYNVLIKDCIVSHYDITALNTATSYVGGFIGYASSHTNESSVTCYVHDSSVENCKIGAPGNYAGGAVGKIIEKTANKILGYNVKLDTITTDSGNNMGTWIGYVDANDDTTSIQFSGIAIYGEGFSKNVGNGTVLATASFVFASYDEDSNTNTSNVSGFNYNAATHVEMPKYPYINVNPKSGMGTNEYITGDGAALYNGAPMAKKICTDLSDTDNTRRYTTFDSITNGRSEIGAYLDPSLEETANRITTYKTATGTQNDNTYDDFAVIVITNSDNAEITKLINRYIQLVTNTTKDYTSTDAYYTIETNRCAFNTTSGKFELLSNDHGGVTFTSPYFQVQAGNADSLYKGTAFTLIDVQFKDPFNTNKIAYHLYVPVYTVKQMEVTFNSYTMTGTMSSTSYYDIEAGLQYTQPDEHLDGFDTWVTQYVRFTYNSDDIEALLRSNNLDWNHDKTLQFITKQNHSRLPEGTYLVLVDPNNDVDQAYYPNKNIEDYPGGEDALVLAINAANFPGYQQCKLSDLVKGKLTATAAEEGEYAEYRLATEQDSNVIEAKVEIEGVVVSRNFVYDQGPAQEGQTRYSLAVSSGKQIQEDYYLMMYVPESSKNGSTLYYYILSCEKQLTGRKNAAVTAVEKNVLIADLFLQTGKTLTVYTDEDDKTCEVEIDSGNRKIYVTAKTEISINSEYVESVLKHAYHSFYFTLNRYKQDGGVEDMIYGLLNEEDAIKPHNVTLVSCKISEGSVANSAVEVPKRTVSSDGWEIEVTNKYINVKTGDLYDEIMDYYYGTENNEQKQHKVIVETTIAMDFPENELEREFPNAPQNSQQNIGVNVAVSSNFAFEDERLTYTSMTSPFDPDDHYFYRKDSARVTLYYFSKNELDEFDYFGDLSDNYSRLGINGFSDPTNENSELRYTASKEDHMKGMEVTAEATYNLQQLDMSDLAEAEYLHLTVSLQKKENVKDDGGIIGARYSDVDMKNYLKNADGNGTAITFSSGDGVRTATTTSTVENDLTVAEISADGKTATVLIPWSVLNQGERTNRLFTISITFYPLTGPGFTEYANYKMTLEAEFVKADGSTLVTSTKANKDSIVYTNAKVYPSQFPMAQRTQQNSGSEPASP